MSKFSKARPLKVYLVAGEASGDFLGAQLMKAMKARSENAVQFSGIGGPLMAEQGLDSLFPMSDLSIMGLVEVIPQIPKVLKRLKQTVSAVSEFDPDVVLTIDSPGFSKRLVRRLKATGTRAKLIHYVAPSVWAWRPGRAKKMAVLYDHLLTLLPFEPPYFEKEGLSSTFVGHPILESGAEKGDGKALRQRLGLTQSDKLLCILPGSRRGEIERHVPIFKATFARLRLQHPNLQAVVVVAPSVAEQLAEVEWGEGIHLITNKEEKYAAMAASNAALAASGTVTLELAMAGVPTVVSYQANALTVYIVRKLIKVPYVGLINILAKEEVMPELLQEQCNPEALSDALAQLLGEGGQQQAEKTKQALALLQPSDGVLPSQKAAATLCSCVSDGK